ncbi:MAG: E3 binding domain-containing protein, partial [Actinobacteria bacterium]|nr:E3 binding domain-containing protein [Actinomycetota bacterium]
MTTVTMPQLGETVIEGTILKWLKKEGERVELDEPLLEISTDKVDTEVPSPAAGVVARILVAEGETVAVGTQLAEIQAGEGAAGAGTPPDSAQIPSQAPEEATPSPERGPRSEILSPLVRKLAAEHNVDLSQV